MKKVTIYDLSNKLGISTATVNRALNNKPKVSDETRQLVIKTAKELGYKPSRAASSLSRTPIKIGFVITCSIHDFLVEVEAGARQAFTELADFNLSGEFIFVSENTSQDTYISQIKEFANKGFDGIILMPHTNERLTRIACDYIKSKGIYFATIVSDVQANRLFSVRNNGVIAGRMAAEMLSFMVQDNSPIVMVTGNKDSVVHAETVTGFIEFANKCNLNFVGVYEHQDDPDIGYILANKIINDYPDIGGIYLGSANSVTFCKRICELGKGGQIKIVASDIFPVMVNLIQQGIVNASIFQNPYMQGMKSVQFMFDYLAEDRKINQDPILLDPQIILKSNLDLFVPKHI